jgi:hypothetical protein
MCQRRGMETDNGRRTQNGFFLLIRWAWCSRDGIVAEARTASGWFGQWWMGDVAKRMRREHRMGGRWCCRGGNECRDIKRSVFGFELFLVLRQTEG